jgi:hydrogenase nickel incorporation protein HypA/HybF
MDSAAMDELDLAEAIVDEALRRAEGRRVTRIMVRVGRHSVDKDVVTMGISLAAVGTDAEGAQVELIGQPMSMRCAECGHAVVVDDTVDLVACANCGCFDIDIIGSETLALEAITVALPEHA